MTMQDNRISKENAAALAEWLVENEITADAEIITTRHGVFAAQCCDIDGKITKIETRQPFELPAGETRAADLVGQLGEGLDLEQEPLRFHNGDYLVAWSVKHGN
ncbi:hypothetical protein AB0B28_17550 [Glycomyces sp. NPDC046736]|uniref:hypothetical protein n=1 Tax=Glycomyces sp. NPDC046736 TaxID=3155615 RepID=UPI0033DB0CD0